MTLPDVLIPFVCSRIGGARRCSIRAGAEAVEAVAPGGRPAGAEQPVGKPLARVGKKSPSASVLQRRDPFRCRQRCLPQNFFRPQSILFLLGNAMALIALLLSAAMIPTTGGAISVENS